MEITKEDGLYVANAFKDYFNNFENIEQYMRDEKLKSLEDLPATLFPIEDDLFSDFSMHPNDMDLSLIHI